MNLDKKTLIFIMAIKEQGHPLEPFPIRRKPEKLIDKIHFAFIDIRWRIVSPFVSYRSILNGRYWYE